MTLGELVRQLQYMTEILGDDTPVYAAIQPDAPLARGIVGVADDVNAATWLVISGDTPDEATARSAPPEAWTDANAYTAMHEREQGEQ